MLKHVLGDAGCTPLWLARNERGERQAEMASTAVRLRCDVAYAAPVPVLGLWSVTCVA
jgi:hypothetical protein